MYAVEWRALEVCKATGSWKMLAVGDGELSISCDWLASRATRAELAAKLESSTWAATVAAAATQRASLARSPLFALEVALMLVQAQASTTAAFSVWLLTAGAQLGRGGASNVAHAGPWGLARSAIAEASLPVKSIDWLGAVAIEVAASLGSELEAVVDERAVCVPRLGNAPDTVEHSASVTLGAHLITGGTGGLGLLTGRWLAFNGARSLVLVSRSGSLARDMASEREQLEQIKTIMLVRRGDTSETVYVQRLVSLANGRMTGLWHASGLLADGLLSNQTAEALAHVYAPKAHGAWMLQRACSAAMLRACALFSSVAALLGGAGQANYAAANSCLDALASHRRTRSQCGVGVQWGAWAEVGMASRGLASARVAAMEAASGIRRITLALGLGALHAAVRPRAASLVGVFPVQWQKMVGGNVVPAFLAVVVPRTSQRVAQGNSRAETALRAAGCEISLQTVLKIVRHTAGGGVDADAPLMEAGVDSLGAVELRNQLQGLAGDGVALSSTLMFDHPTARSVAVHLQGDRPAAALIGSAGGDAAGGCGRVDVEVAGVSMALPKGVSSAVAMREMSHCGCNLLSVVPAARWDVELVARSLHDFSADMQGRVRHGAFVCDAALFENSFFSISPAEASAMDPQQRQLLERGYTSLHAAGMSKATLLGSIIAVNVGQWASEYSSVIAGTRAASSVYSTTGYQCSVTCGRVSFTLGMQGPCASYDTACSASLVANHGSVRALQRVECSAALSAGVNMILDPSMMLTTATGGFTSVKGRSHTFDVRADGYARGEAIGAFACRLGKEDAVVWMVGSAVRQDGRSASLTAPNGQAQQGVLVASLSDAQLVPEEAVTLEAHGTGTALGDPIEAGSMAAIFLSQRPSTPYAVGSLKASSGHAEPGAGLAGAFKLFMQLNSEALSPNAQLRALNPHVGATLRSYTRCWLPTQVGELTNGELAALKNGGTSSYGYAGTIAHTTMLRHQQAVAAASGSAVLLAYRRGALPWSYIAASPTSARTHTYSLCWSPADAAVATLLSPCMFLTNECTMAAHPPPSMFSLWHKVALALTAISSACPIMHGVHLILTLAQQLIGLTPPSQLLILTSGGLAFEASYSSEAHGSTWGLARVLRLEHSALHTQNANVCHLVSSSAPLALSVTTPEAEAAWCGAEHAAARLRACGAPSVQDGVLTHGLNAITGGLGGLGLRAAALLAERGADTVLLASRSGRLTRDGQSLDVQLRSMRTIVLLLACDSADARDASEFISAHPPSGLLHAAGVGDKGLLVELEARRLQWMHASKAAGSWHLQCASATVPLRSRVLFSSVGSGLGNVGQASYASANAYLDAHGRSRRAVGMAACSVQWPLVGGAGMGAAAFAAMCGRQVTIAGLAGISLEEYATCLTVQLATVASMVLSVQMAHLSESRVLLDLADATQPRFSELVAQTKLDDVSDTPATPHADAAAGSGLASSLESIRPLERRAHVEASVVRVIRELTGESSASLTAETPLMEAGVDSLAATELSSRLSALTGVAFSPTLVFEQPTPGAIASHILEQTAGSVKDCTIPSAENVHVRLKPSASGRFVVAGALGQWSGNCDTENARVRFQRACGDALGSVPAAR